jgi:hypothetical protein
VLVAANVLIDRYLLRLPLRSRVRVTNLAISFLSIGGGISIATIPLHLLVGIEAF